MGKTGNTGENAEDNNIEERISKYVDWDVAISENIDFGGFTGEDVIINLLVDDGVEDRSHRSNLFNTKIMGISLLFKVSKIYLSPVPKPA